MFDAKKHFNLRYIFTTVASFDKYLPSFMRLGFKQNLNFRNIYVSVMQRCKLQEQNPRLVCFRQQASCLTPSLAD